MANIQYYDVILKPVITEKSMELMGRKEYTFFVHPEANKTMIKEAVEKMFEGTKVKRSKKNLKKVKKEEEKKGALPPPLRAASPSPQKPL